MPAVPYLVGFAAEQANSEKARHGSYENAMFNADTPIITFWADHYNLRQGDRLEMRLSTPSGQVISENSRTMEKNKARWFQFIGRRRPQSGWPKGVYTAEIRVYPFDQDSSAVRSKTVKMTVQ